MSPNVAVIGSGLAALSATRALLRRGLDRVVVLDAGLRLDADRSASVARMAATEPSGWAPADVAAVTENPTIRSHAIPKKLVFGSDFHFAGAHPAAPLAGDSAASPTLAYGGYGVAWGAAILPADPADIADWPLPQGALDASYRAVFSWLPLSAAHDRLASVFPLHADDTRALALPPQAAALRADLERINRRDIVHGQARLAVAAPACRRCGSCLSGCVYGAIFNPADAWDRLVAGGRVDYRPGWLVRRLEEDAAGVNVTMRALDSTEDTRLRFNRVLVAAGALNSTRIILESRDLYRRKVRFRDSQKFVVPWLRRRGAALVWPDTNTLAALFLEMKLAELGGNWMHVQLSGDNDFILQKLGIDRPGLRRSVLMPVARRLMAAWCSLHSAHSAEIEAELAPADNGHAPALVLRDVELDRARRSIAIANRALARAAISAQSLAVVPATRISRPGAGNHLGGSLPMQAAPSGPLACDTLGRPGGWQRIHVVDSAVLPSIPATTIALPIMANADRIATQAPLV